MCDVLKVIHFESYCELKIFNIQVGKGMFISSKFGFLFIGNAVSNECSLLTFCILSTSMLCIGEENRNFFKQVRMFFCLELTVARIKKFQSGFYSIEVTFLFFLSRKSFFHQRAKLLLVLLFLLVS